MDLCRLSVFQFVHQVRVSQKRTAHGGALDAPAGELLLHEIGVVQAADPAEGQGGILPHLVAELEEAPRLAEIGMAGRGDGVLQGRVVRQRHMEAGDARLLQQRDEDRKLFLRHTGVAKVRVLLPDGQLVINGHPRDSRPDGPDAAEYSRRMAQATALLEGKLRAVTTQLTEQMNAAAEALDFETAAALRDRVRALSVLTKDQQVIAGICADTDVWGAYTSPARSGCAILHIEDGDLLARQTEVFPDAADSESALLSAVVPQYYLTRQSLPREILLPAAIEDADALSALLTERSGHAVALRVPQRGQRRALLDIAHRNAREEVERVTDAVQRINGTLRLLQETAQLPVLPRRMESYDISHTGGADQVGGMVVFQDGKPLKSAYRRFRIESCAGADDYGAMREVLTRRFRRYLDGDEKFAPLPDLLLIDGGQEHARVAEQVLAETGLDVPVLGMVKDDRHRTRALITARGHELGIQQTPALFALIGTVQEEVHRFAIAYHHQKHTRSAKRSQLDGIPGVGEARKKRLLQHFGTVTAVKNATLEQLSAVVPEAAARAVYEKFHG